VPVVVRLVKLKIGRFCRLPFLSLVCITSCSPLGFPVFSASPNAVETTTSRTVMTGCLTTGLDTEFITASLRPGAREFECRAFIPNYASPSECRDEISRIEGLRWRNASAIMGGQKQIRLRSLHLTKIGAEGSVFKRTLNSRPGCAASLWNAHRIEWCARLTLRFGGFADLPCLSV
jgi:hypothetical protein